MIILFQDILLPKEFIGCIGFISSYLAVLNSGLELVSSANFSTCFFHENSPFVIILHHLTKSHYQTFFTSQNNKLFGDFKFEFIHLITSINSGFISNQLLLKIQQCPTGEKKWWGKSKNLNSSRTKDTFSVK